MTIFRRNKTDKLWKKRGFTTIELIIYLAAFVLITVTVADFFVNVIRRDTLIMQKVKDIDEAEFAMRQIFDNIRMAESINSATYNDSNNGAISLTVSGNTVSFAVVDDNGVNRIQRNGSDYLTSKQINIDEFLIECIGSGCDSAPVGVRVKIVLKNLSNNETYTLQTSAVPRGY